MKLSLFANDMVIYVENPKESNNKNPGTSEDSKVTRYKLPYRSQLISYILAMDN